MEVAPLLDAVEDARRPEFVRPASGFPRRGRRPVVGIRDIAARDRGEAARELDSRDGVAAPCELHSRLPGSRPDLEYPRAPLEARQLGEVVEDGLGIRGASTVVQLGDPAERPAQLLA